MTAFLFVSPIVYDGKASDRRVPSFQSALKKQISGFRNGGSA